MYEEKVALLTAHKRKATIINPWKNILHFAIFQHHFNIITITTSHPDVAHDNVFLQPNVTQSLHVTRVSLCCQHGLI